MKISKKLITISIFLSLFELILLIIIFNKHKTLEYNYENCYKNYNDLKKQHSEDSVAMKQLEKDYIEQWEENQIFSSMLSEIESRPGGHEVLKVLFDKKRKKEFQNKHYQ
jgi:hypothetical protein